MTRLYHSRQFRRNQGYCKAHDYGLDIAVSVVSMGFDPTHRIVLASIARTHMIAW
jgi:hypothetical protein